jgi:thioredoxin 1
MWTIRGDNMKLLKFKKQGCVPCQFVSNILNELNVPYEEIDAIENEELRLRYDIQSVPVLILLDDNNKEIGRVNGYDPVGIEQLTSQM